MGMNQILGKWENQDSSQFSTIGNEGDGDIINRNMKEAKDWESRNKRKMMGVEDTLLWFQAPLQVITQYAKLQLLMTL